MEIQNPKYQRNYHRNLVNPIVHPIGLTSSRFQSGLIVGDLLILPISCSLGIWDIKTGERMQIINTNSNSIYCVLSDSKRIYSISYSGEFTILDRTTLAILRVVPQQCGHQTRYASLGDGYLVINAEFSDAPSHERGAVNVFDLQGEMVQSLRGRYGMANVHGGTLVVLYEVKVPIGNRENLTAVQIKKLKNSQKYTYSIQEFSVGNHEVISSVDMAMEGRILCSGQSEHGGSNSGGPIMSYLFEDRGLVIYNQRQHRIVYSGKIAGYGIILACSFYGNDMLLSSTKNAIMTIKCDDSEQLSKLPQLISNQTYEPSIINIINNKAISYEILPKGLDCTVQFIKELGQHQYLIVNEEGVYIVGSQLPFEKIFGGITFCGVDISHDKKYVVAGDFTGSVTLFQIDGLHIESMYTTNIGLPIRSLVHLQNFPIVIFGTVTGQLFLWDYINDPELIAELDGSITIIRQQQINDQCIIIASTTEGHFHLLQYDNTSLNHMHKYHAHKPQGEFDRQKFGSLDQRAEMWSICFNPTNPQMVATCSEDQTVHVYTGVLSQDPKQVRVLEGHSLAVTSVDWKVMQRGLVLASCSDDMTIRFYGENFDLIRVISTAWIKEWHTLTYLALQDNGDLVAIGAQNGYFFLYSLEADKFVYAEKIHMGGIEGLIWRDNLICTCSSDNIINVIDINQLVIVNN